MSDTVERVSRSASEISPRVSFRPRWSSASTSARCWSLTLHCRSMSGDASGAELFRLEFDRFIEGCGMVTGHAAGHRCSTAAIGAHRFCRPLDLSHSRLQTLCSTSRPAPHATKRRRTTNATLIHPSPAPSPAWSASPHPPWIRRPRRRRCRDRPGGLRVAGHLEGPRHPAGLGRCALRRTGRRRSWTISWRHTPISRSPTPASSTTTAGTSRSTPLSRAASTSTSSSPTTPRTSRCAPCPAWPQISAIWCAPPLSSRRSWTRRSRRPCSTARRSWRWPPRRNRTSCC